MIVAPLHYSRSAVAVGLWPLLRLFLELDSEVPPQLWRACGRKCPGMDVVARRMTCVAAVLWATR
jgi:hypothetical protein